MTRNMLLGTALMVCVLTSINTSAQRMRVANEGDIKDRWMLREGTRLAAPAYPAQFKDRKDDVCIAMGYSINPKGTTDDFAVIRTWNSAAGENEPAAGYWDAFAQAGAAALAQWQFTPRPGTSSPQRVYTVATMLFIASSSSDATVVRAHCQIDDLEAALRQNTGKAYSRGKDKFESERRNTLIRQERQRSQGAVMRNRQRN